MTPTTERARIVRILDTLALPTDEYVVAGSGSVLLHDVEREKPPGDLDVFCTTRLWFALLGHVTAGSTWSVFIPDTNDRAARCDPPYLFREVEGLEVNVFSQWRQRGVGDIRIADWLASAETCHGFPCVPLMLLLDWKLAVGRSKDLEDVLLLQRVLGVEGAIS